MAEAFMLLTLRIAEDPGATPQAVQFSTGQALLISILVNVLLYLRLFHASASRWLCPALYTKGLNY